MIVELQTLNEVAEFCLERQGRNWRGWPRHKIVAYIAFQISARACHVARRWDGGTIVAVAFAWPEVTANVVARESAKDPQFAWTVANAEGNCLLIAEVFGDRKGLRDLVHMGRERWDNFDKVKKLMYRGSRAGKLRLLSSELLERVMS